MPAANAANGARIEVSATADPAAAGRAHAGPIGRLRRRHTQAADRPVSGHTLAQRRRHHQGAANDVPDTTARPCSTGPHVGERQSRSGAR